MEEDIVVEVYEDEDSQDEITEEEFDFLFEYELEIVIDIGLESEENFLGNRYIIYQLSCFEYLCICVINFF